MWFICIDFMSDMKSCFLNCKGRSIKEHFKPFYYLAYLESLFLEMPFQQTLIGWQMFIVHLFIKSRNSLCGRFLLQVRPHLVSLSMKICNVSWEYRDHWFFSPLSSPNNLNLHSSGKVSKRHTVTVVSNRGCKV